MLPCISKWNLKLSIHRMDNYGNVYQQHATPIKDAFLESFRGERKQKKWNKYMFPFPEISTHHGKFKNITELGHDLIIHELVNSWNKTLNEKNDQKQWWIERTLARSRLTRK